MIQIQYPTMPLDRDIQQTCPALTYACGTWSLTKEYMYKIRATQRAIERAILGISLQAHVSNENRNLTLHKGVGNPECENGQAEGR